MKKHFKIIVQGKVQNVGFRYYTNKRAQMSNVSGFVKNQHDGTVYIEVEGDEIDIQTFLDFVNTGPQWGRVDNVQINEGPLMGYSGFEIK